VTEVGTPDGTTIEVADLFYNLPARRKFLKSDSAESAQVSKIVTQLALCYPEIGFALTSAGRRVVEVPPVGTLRERLFQLYGERDDLVPLHRDGDVRIEGYVAALAEQGPTRGPQNIFINRRIIKDRTIAHAIIEAYSVASIKERSPEVHLFIEMPRDAVDVNVHPTKAEVRFKDQSYMHQIVRRTLGDALGRGPAPELILQPPSAADPGGMTLPLPHSYPSVFPSRWSAPSGAGLSGVPGALSALTGVTPVGERSPFSVPTEAALVATGVAGASPLRPMMALGQFRDTFIIAVDDEGIAIIDQHVAHERVLFERITERLSSGTFEGQRLLVPLLVALPASGRQALMAHAPDLVRLGFEVEEFGGDEVRISALPALLTREDGAAAVRALADDLEHLDTGSRVEEAVKRIAATMACHAAVKANYPLTPEKMAHILDELRRTAYSTICPHGRPVMLRLTRREVEKNFQRI
jgi:DNA mismatch repair protein MutL